MSFDTLSQADIAKAKQVVKLLQRNGIPTTVVLTFTPNPTTVAPVTTVNLSTLQAATLNTFQPANPVGTASGSLVMMGLGTTAVVTHTKTAKFMISIWGQAVNDTAGDGWAIVARFGTGVAPANGAAFTGASLFPTHPNSGAHVISTNAGTAKMPFAFGGYVDNSANLNVATWIDLALNAQVGGTVNLQNVEFVIAEMSN